MTDFLHEAPPLKASTVGFGTEKEEVKGGVPALPTDKVKAKASQAKKDQL